MDGLIEEFYLNVYTLLEKKQKDVAGLKKNIEHLEEVVNLQENNEGSDADEVKLENRDDPKKLTKERPFYTVSMPKSRKRICEHVMKVKDVEGKEFKWEEREEDGEKVKDSWVRNEHKRTKRSVDAKYDRKLTYDRTKNRETSYVCPRLMKDGKCNYAHSAIQLDQMKDYNTTKHKRENLMKVKEHMQKTLEKDKPLDPWRPSAKNFDVSKLKDPNALRKKEKKGDGEDNEPKKHPRGFNGILDRDPDAIARKPFDKE